ncbi:zinc finger BED domain-containing protein 5-like [Sitodiplosis mosellana]|uniref:zinc finger BED domain-containing protein 5-like n=1 Tax=Sitodiplosis mosellana TaxID=263140 RepID=UPI002443A71A|nr:zinc finger BED domain-containing protein 5-like [Sitodiplosis mosellana]
MDRFVTVTKKRRPDESDEGESSGVSSSDKRPSTSNQNVMESVEQQKKKNRKFNSEWEENYFVTEHNGKAMCLICRHEFAENKKYNVESHFNKQHSEMNKKFLPSSEKRSTEILRLKSALESEQKIVKNFFSTNHLVTRASYEVAFNIAKHGKFYSDGEFYKQLMQSTVATLCENLDEKLKAPLHDKMKMLSLSHQTVSRRVVDIGAEMEANLKRDLEECEAISVALDETIDISDVSQLIF